jgi:sulfur carrier protein
MKLVINGEAREVDGVTTVAELLLFYKLEHKILVVELNRTIIDREAYERTLLQAGDQLEIVHFVGGG